MNSGLFFCCCWNNAMTAFSFFFFRWLIVLWWFFLFLFLWRRKKGISTNQNQIFSIFKIHTHTHASHSFFRFHFQNVFIIFRGYGFFSRLLFYHYRRCVAIVFVFTILSHIFYILTKLNFNLKSHYSTTTTVMMMTWKQKPGIIFFLSLKQTPFHSKLWNVCLMCVW